MMRMYSNMVLLTLEQVTKLYGFTDKHKAKRIIGALRVSGEHRVTYYLCDVTTDIVKRRIGIVR
ncbi:MAG: hypothetical protein U0N76_11860 [Eubacteriales bacterium]